MILQTYDAVAPGDFVGEKDWEEEWKSSVTYARQSTTLARRLIELEERIVFSALDQTFLNARGEWRTILKSLYVRLDDTMTGAQTLYNSVSLTKEVASSPVNGSEGAFDFRLNDKLPFDNLKAWLRDAWVQDAGMLQSRTKGDSNAIRFHLSQPGSNIVAGSSGVQEMSHENLAVTTEPSAVDAQSPTFELEFEGGQEDHSDVPTRTSNPNSLSLRQLSLATSES